MSDHIPTFADLCCAIAEGELAATVEGSMYHVNALELRRYLNKRRPLPKISTVDDPPTDPMTKNWSISVA